MADTIKRRPVSLSRSHPSKPTLTNCTEIKVRKISPAKTEMSEFISDGDLDRAVMAAVKAVETRGDPPLIQAMEVQSLKKCHQMTLGLQLWSYVRKEASHGRISKRRARREDFKGKVRNFWLCGLRVGARESNLMSDMQQEHVVQVERLLPDLSALRKRICPGLMPESTFWKFYFERIHPEFNAGESEILSTNEHRWLVQNWKMEGILTCKMAQDSGGVFIYGAQVHALIPAKYANRPFAGERSGRPGHLRDTGKNFLKRKHRVDSCAYDASNEKKHRMLKDIMNQITAQAATITRLKWSHDVCQDCRIL